MKIKPKFKECAKTKLKKAMLLLGMSFVAVTPMIQPMHVAAVGVTDIATADKMYKAVETFIERYDTEAEALKTKVAELKTLTEGYDNTEESFAAIKTKAGEIAEAYYETLPNIEKNIKSTQNSVIRWV